MYKKSIHIILSIVIVLLLSMVCLADENIQSVMKPSWNYLETYLNYFDISSTGKATVEVVLEAHNTDEFRIQANLQQYKNGGWTTYHQGVSKRSGLLL